jgi:hypothetical protein
MAIQSDQASTSSGALSSHLHPKQWKALDTSATEVLYGGAAGGGKSHLMRLAAITWCFSIPGLQVYLFRRISGDLYLNHMEGPKGFRALLAPWVNSGWCRVVENQIRFWNGAKIHLCHCEHEQDIYKYQGSEIHVLLIDELTHFTEPMYRFLRGRTRQVGIELPAEFKAKFPQVEFPRILCGANPGNVGHLWVKNTFIHSAVPLAIRPMPPHEGGMKRQYVPARLEDNPSLVEDDPGYEARLEGLGSKTLVAAMRWGDWDVVEGAFFDCWSNAKHVIPAFTIPRDWVRFRSMDWGSASPASIGWWAVVQDDYHLNRVGGEDNAAGAGKSSERNGVVRVSRAGSVLLPRGALIRYREDYVADPANHKGIKLTAELVAARIAEREKGDPKLSYGVLDPSTFKEDGGPSVAERMNTVLIREHHIAGFRKADNARVPRTGNRDRGGPMSGWDQVRARMIGKNGIPYIYCFNTCHDSIRTIPVLQHDPNKAEDLDTKGEDHAADDWRYACLSRPWLRAPPEKKEVKDAYQVASEAIPQDSFKTM